MPFIETRNAEGGLDREVRFFDARNNPLAEVSFGNVLEEGIVIQEIKALGQPLSREDFRRIIGSIEELASREKRPVVWIQSRAKDILIYQALGYTFDQVTGTYVKNVLGGKVPAVKYEDVMFRISGARKQFGRFTMTKQELLREGSFVRLKSGTEGWVKGQIVEYFDVIPSVGGVIYTGPGYKVDILEGKHKGETIKVPANYVEPYVSTKTREPLYPHVPLKREPLFPHVPKSQGEPIPPQYQSLVELISEPLLPAIEPEEGERKVDAVLRTLKDGVEGIQDSYQFRLFLTTMSKFHDYSIGNQILIMIQRRDATHVAGFVTWKELGRWVKSGEKGIAILAPRFPPRPTCAKCGTRIPKGAAFCPKCGASVEEGEIGMEPAYFIVVSVFDISQTEGKPLPEFEVPTLTGEVNEELFAKVMALAKAQGLTVSFESRPQQDPSTKGEYSGKSIWIRPEEPRAQQLKSSLHEVAHYYSEGVFRIPKRDAETIAESAAFVVGAHYGFDSGVRSFPYVALWARDKKVLQANLGAIRQVSTTILEALDLTILTP